MNQVFIGALVPFLVGVAIYARGRGRISLRALLLLPLTMGLGAIWATLPDIPRLLGMTDLYFRLASDPRTDIFFWHYTIDLAETDSSWYTAGVVLMIVALIGTAWRELYLLENE